MLLARTGAPGAQNLSPQEPPLLKRQSPNAAVAETYPDLEDPNITWPDPVIHFSPRQIENSLADHQSTLPNQLITSTLRPSLRPTPQAAGQALPYTMLRCGDRRAIRYCRR